MKKSWRHDIVVIGGSAGALEPLRTLLDLLPAGLSASLFVAIHIPADFPSILPELLSQSGTWKARHPLHHEAFRPGEIVVAPPDFHLIVENERVVLSGGPRENRHRPSIDVLFRSAARAYGPRVAAVVLSGQLDDGSSGLMAVKAKGGATIVQDPAEASAPEMPNRAIRYASPAYVLPVRQIAELLISICNPELPIADSLEGSMSDQLKQEVQEANLEAVPPREPPGRPSAFACPDCHGVLWELEEGQLLRFRCRVGHAYTADALSAALSGTVEDALWAAMRVLEEKVALLRRLAERLSSPRMSAQYKEEASGFETHARTIRNMLVEKSNFAGKEELSDAA